MIRNGVILAMIALAGCATTPRTLQIPSSKLVQSPANAPRTAGCQWRLENVEDLRPREMGAGGLGATRIEIPDAGALLAELMRQHGVAGTTGIPLTLRLHRLYMRQQNDSKVPTVVVEVLMQGAEPLMVRVQDTSVSWTFSDEAARRGFTNALTRAADEIRLHLDSHCANPDS